MGHYCALMRHYCSLMGDYCALMHHYWAFMVHYQAPMVYYWALMDHYWAPMGDHLQLSPPPGLHRARSEMHRRASGGPARKVWPGNHERERGAHFRGNLNPKTEESGWSGVGRL